MNNLLTSVEKAKLVSSLKAPSNKLDRALSAAYPTKMKDCGCKKK